MKMGLQEVDWEYVGACLANEDSIAQTAFFKSFVKECRSWGTVFQDQRQLADTNNKLTSDEKQCLSMIGYEEE